MILNEQTEQTVNKKQNKKSYSIFKDVFPDARTELYDQLCELIMAEHNLSS